MTYEEKMKALLSMQSNLNSLLDRGLDENGVMAYWLSALQEIEEDLFRLKELEK